MARIPEAGERWRFKPNRGSGTFRVTRVVGDRVHLEDWRGKYKRISLKTLRGDYEPVGPASPSSRLTTEGDPS